MTMTTDFTVLPTNARLAAMFDDTAAVIETPGGPGRFVEFDPGTGQVTVEVDHSYLVTYPADQCFLMGGGRPCAAAGGGTSA